MKINALCHDVPCDHGIAERPRYYPRQLVTADDMTLEQEYFRNKLRLHNRLLHGWGVVCGAEVCPVPAPNEKASGYEPWKVLVKPGYALDCCGNEINIDCCRVVDLRTNGVTVTTGDPCVQAQDPWCSEIFVDRNATEPLYVAVKYKPMKTRPVRVQPVGCGCDDNACEYSRWRDGYEISVLTYCPETHLEEPKREELAQVIPKCPECTSDPWVGLAKIQVDENGRTKTIDNCVCRRIMTSYANLWRRCTAITPEIQDVDPASVAPGSSDFDVNIRGAKFKEGLHLNLGQGIKVVSATIEETLIRIKINVDNDAVAGPRSVTVVNPDCSTATKDDAITINETRALPPPSQRAPKGESQRRTGRGGRGGR